MQGTLQNSVCSAGGNGAFCTENGGNSLPELINDADPHLATYIHRLNSIMSWRPNSLEKEATLQEKPGDELSCMV